MDDWLIRALIGYELVALVSQDMPVVPSLPTLTRILVNRPKAVRWTFIAALVGVLIWHLELP